MSSVSIGVPVHDLLRRPGVRRQVERHVTVDHLAVSSASVPEGGEAVVDVVLEAIGDDIVATGTVCAPWTGLCRRCLGEVTSQVCADVREIFQRHPVEGETYLLGDGVVDLGPMVAESVLLALPLAPLCSTECAGPDPDRFPAVPGDEEPAGEVTEMRDPRWAVLDELRFDEPGEPSDEAELPNEAEPPTRYEPPAT